MSLAGHCSGLYQQIQDEGAALEGRGVVDFRGGLVKVADDAAGDRTIVHIGKQPNLTDLFATADAAPHLTLGAAGKVIGLSDTLRFLTAGVAHMQDDGANERARFATASPHVTLGGAAAGGGITRVNDRLTVNGAISTADLVTLNIGAFINVVRTAGTRVLTGNTTQVNQIAAGAGVDIAGFQITTALRGMAFGGSQTDSVGGGLINAYNAVDTAAALSAACTIARYFNAPVMSGSVAPATAVVLEGPNIRAAGLAAGYGYRQADITTGPIARSLEHGPIGAPWLRMLMSGEWAPAADQTPLYLAEGAGPTLRNVQFMDPGAAGVNFVGGERVMVLV